MYKLTGTIYKIEDTVQVTESFSKRLLVVTDNHPEYPQFIPFEMTQDKCDILDKFGEGQEVEVSFNLKGREWTSPQGEVKYFGTFDAWRVEECSKNVAKTEEEKTPEEPVSTEADDDLPF
jgi:hypothetical protein